LISSAVVVVVVLLSNEEDEDDEEVAGEFEFNLLAFPPRERMGEETENPDANAMTLPLL